MNSNASMSDSTTSAAAVVPHDPNASQVIPVGDPIFAQKQTVYIKTTEMVWKYAAAMASMLATQTKDMSLTTLIDSYKAEIEQKTVQLAVCNARIKAFEEAMAASKMNQQHTI